MQSPVPEIAPHLTATLAALRADGISPSDAEVVWLARLRWVCDHPEDGSIPWVSGAPVQYGGAIFWPMHRLGELWFIRAHRLLEGMDKLQVAAYMFAHVNSAPGDRTLLYITSDADVVREVSEWFDMLALHDDQIIVLTDRLRQLDGQADVETVSNGTDDAPAITDSITAGTAGLCKAFPGTTPDYWMSGVSAAEARGMMESVATHNGCFANSPRRTRAVSNYLNAVKQVRLNHGPAA